MQRGVLLLRVDGTLNATGLINDPRLLDTETAHRLELGEMAIYAAFFGLCLALLVYNLVFWLTMRERFQLVYCGSVVAMLAYAGLHSGVADMLFPTLGAAWRLRLNYLALGCLAVLALRFVAAFLPPRSMPHLLSRLLDAGCVAILLASLAATLAPAGLFYFADRAYVLAFVPLPFLAVALCLYGWRHDRDSVRVLVIAWSLPTAMAVVRILHSLNVIGFSSFVEHSVVFAMSFEALLSSLAMSLRIRHVLGERDLARAEEHAARRLSEIDPLTGLQNRRALLANAVDMAPGQPLRLLLVDIDFFKSINDTYGHGVGDEVLREVATVLARSLEIRGTAARLGGEEFALLGPAADLPDDLALSVLTDIRGADMPEGIRITVSIGSADGVVGHEGDWRDLYRRADAALYDAKHSGRNCHVVGQKPRLLPGAAAAA
jgi:diguanylate cyclase (GGDEF)-like protein